MKVQIPYGIVILQVGTCNIYSLKLRFNAASWSWIEPEIEKLGAFSTLIAVSKRNDYCTVQFQTTQYEKFEQVRAAINSGQIAQQEELLHLWKESGYRNNAKHCFREGRQVTVEW